MLTRFQARKKRAIILKNKNNDLWVHWISKLWTIHIFPFVGCGKDACGLLYTCKGFVENNDIMSNFVYRTHHLCKDSFAKTWTFPKSIRTLNISHWQSSGNCDYKLHQQCVEKLQSVTWPPKLRILFLDVDGLKSIQPLPKSCQILDVGRSFQNGFAAHHGQVPISIEKFKYYDLQKRTCRYSLLETSVQLDEDEFHVCEIKGKYCDPDENFKAWQYCNKQGHNEIIDDSPTLTIDVYNVKKTFTSPRPEKRGFSRFDFANCVQHLWNDLMTAEQIKDMTNYMSVDYDQKDLLKVGVARMCYFYPSTSASCWVRQLHKDGTSTWWPEDCAD